MNVLENFIFSLGQILRSSFDLFHSREGMGEITAVCERGFIFCLTTTFQQAKKPTLLYGPLKIVLFLLVTRMVEWMITWSTWIKVAAARNLMRTISVDVCVLESSNSNRMQQQKSESGTVTASIVKTMTTFIEIPCSVSTKIASRLHRAEAFTFRF